MGIDSRRADGMEVWEVASALGLDKADDEAPAVEPGQSGLVPYDPYAGVDLVRLRAEAAARGLPPPQLPLPSRPKAAGG